MVRDPDCRRNVKASVPSMELDRLSGSIPIGEGADSWDGPRSSPGRFDAFWRRLGRGLGLELLLGLLLCGPVLAWVTYRTAASQHRIVTKGAFGDMLADRSHDLDVQLNSFAELLRSLRGLFDASNVVDRREFGVFTRGARERHPEIALIGYAPRVVGAERGTFEAEVEKAGFPGYRMTSLDGHGAFQTAPPAPEHYPVLYVEPSEVAANTSMMGFDFGSEEFRRRAIARTIESAEPAATEPLRLLSRRDGGPGAVLVLGVYDHGIMVPHPNDVPIGVVFLSFQFLGVVRDLERFSFGSSWSSLDLQWIDESVPHVGTEGSNRRVYPASVGVDAGAEAPFAVEERLLFAGERYLLRATPTSTFLAQHRDVESVLLATLVFVGWELLGLGLYVIARSWRRSALRRQSRAVGLLLRSLAEGVIMSDLSGTVRVANDAALRLLGVTIDELRSPDWFARCGFLRRDGRTSFDPDRAPLARAARGEIVAEEELMVRRPAESRGLSLWASARPLMDEGNVLQGGVMVLRDVTAERRSEEASERLSRAVEQTADAVYITDHRGLIRYANPGFRTTTGFTEVEVLGLSPSAFEAASPDDATPSERRWAGVLAGQAFRGTIRHRRKGGPDFLVEQTITPMTDAAGRVTHAVVVMRDTTERHRLEEAEVEMRLAAEVQQRLYPKGSPSWDGLDVAGAALSAVATCGDYFDYVRFADGTFLLAIGDVSGHGLGPALLMAETRAYLRSLVESGVGMSEILGRVNARLRADLSEGTFVTLLLVGIDPKTHAISHASAGHTPALVIDGNGALKARLTPTGPALGVFDGPAYGCATGSVLEERDVLVLMTDGVSECAGRDGALFDENGVIDVVSRCRGENAETILGTLHGAIDVFAGARPRQDDITLVVCRPTGSFPA